MKGLKSQLTLKRAQNPIEPSNRNVTLHDDLCVHASMSHLSSRSDIILQHDADDGDADANVPDVPGVPGVPGVPDIPDIPHGRVSHVVD